MLFVLCQLNYVYHYLLYSEYLAVILEYYCQLAALCVTLWIEVELPALFAAVDNTNGAGPLDAVNSPSRVCPFCPHCPGAIKTEPIQ